MDLSQDKDEFVESVMYVPEDFESGRDTLPPEFEPEIPDETRKAEMPQEAPQEEPDGTEAGAEKSEAEAEKKAEEDVDEKPKVDPDTLKAELEEVKKRLEKANAKAGYWQRQAEKKLAESKAAEQAAKPLGDEPQYEDFSSDQEYFKALTDWKVEQKLREQDQEKQKAAQAAEAQDFEAWIGEMGAEGVGLFTDFDEVVRDPIVPLTKDVLRAVRSCDRQDVNAAEIVYFLGKNIRETARISRLTPEAIQREIGAIAEKITADRAQAQVADEPAPEPEPPPPKPQPKKISTAPPPIAPIKSGSVSVSKDPAKMTNEEYRKWRSGR